MTRVLARERVKLLLQENKAEELARVAAADQHLVRGLMTLLYDSDADTRDQAAAALGRVSGHAPGRARPLLERLWWALSDESGIFCPGAPLAIAHIALAQPDLARGFVSPLVHFLDDPGHLPAVLHAVALLASLFPEAVADLGAQLEALLAHDDPTVRTLAARALTCVEAAGRLS